MKRIFGALLCVTAIASGAQAQNTVWGNSAQGYGPANIEQFNKTTGARLHQFSGVSGNGRGIVVVGNTVYYTMTGDSNIHMMNATTGADMGSIATPVQSMSTIAWDGTGFWTSDYSGSNAAYHITPAGVVDKTIHLANAGGNSDGMEFFDNKLIANRGDADGTYDVYDLNGNVLFASFINTGKETTGIAFDGTDFFISDIFNNALLEYDASGNFVKTLPLDPNGSGRLIEDLSVDYSQRVDIPGTTAPEPSSLALLGTGLFGLVPTIRRRLK